MPNYIKNRIEILGSKIQVEEIVNKFSTSFAKEPRTSVDEEIVYENKKTGEYGWWNEKTKEFTQRDKEKLSQIPEGFEIEFIEAWTRFPDFNKIIEMPKEMDIQINSRVEMAVQVTLGMQLNGHPLIAALEKMNRERSESPLKLSDEEWNQFIICLNNVRHYGFIYWYDWCSEKWNTKWNSSECEKVNENTFDFITAWSGVPDLIEKMSKEVPDVKIIYKWSDEDTGSNCGIGEYKNGKGKVRIPKNSSKEAYDLAFELRPEKRENYKLIEDSYQYIDEE